MSEAVLRGLRVVETADLCAELAGRWLADLGADVWKIEPPRGAASRELGEATFQFYDAGKHSVVLDPLRPGDAARARALVASADVWLGSARHSIQTELVTSVHPRLIRVLVTPFGTEDPFLAVRADDLIAQAAGGMAYANRLPGEPPRRGFGLPAFHAASLYAVIGTLLALIERERSGLGQSVEVSLREAAIGAVAGASTSSPFRVCRCGDGHVAVGPVGDWTTLRGWLAQSGYLLPADATGAVDEVFAVLERWASERSANEIFAGAQLRRLPFAPVRSPRDLLDDPQLAAREFFTTVPGTPRRMPGPAFRMSRTPLRTGEPAPRLGQDEWPNDRDPSATRASHETLAEAGGRALDGIRVLDFTHVVAGPIATRILADHGAEVIKIERIAVVAGEERQRGPFASLHRGKRSVALDLSDARGVDLARRIAARSDVVIDNFSPRVMEHWGLDYEQLRRLRPDIIAASLSGFGRSGPYRDFVSFAPTLHALCGYDRLMPGANREPAGWGYAHSDACAGLHGALAVLAALFHRRRGGCGQSIDLSQLESVVALMGPSLLTLAEHPEPHVEPEHGHEAISAPSGIYRAAGDDRWIAIAVTSDEEWSRFASVVDEPWAADPRLSHGQSRAAEAPRLRVLVERWTSGRAAGPTAGRLRASGVAAAEVASLADLERDPELHARGFWAELPTAEGARTRIDGVPARLERTPGRVDATAPLHGEHGDVVLRTILDLAPEDIRQLRAARVLG